MKKLVFIASCAALACAAEPALKDVPFHFDANFKCQVTPRHVYNQEMVGKLFLCQALFDKPFKRRDNGQVRVAMTCEQAVETLRAMDAITLGLPKVIYLVGWQYNGHDSKYPSFFEGNPAIKRACDKDPLDSVRWVMDEGRAKYHTAVSLHVNMLDAYPDSDLFDKYLANDVIAKGKDGKPLPSEWGYKISYPQEWAKGFAQERLERLLKLLPIRAAGTLQIDAFHSCAPIGYVDEKGRRRVRFQSPISPYLKFTRQDDIDAQKNIVKFLDARGVDVTEEGCVQNSDGQLAGTYIPFIYHYGSGNYFRYPRTVLGGMDCGSPWSWVFGKFFNIEQLFMKRGTTPAAFEEFKREFCRKTLVANYLNRFTPVRAQQGAGVYRVTYEKDLVATFANGAFTLTQGACTLAQGGDTLIPALWTPARDLVAYSEKGCTARSWRLPADFPQAGTAQVFAVDAQGRHACAPVAYANGQIALTLPPGQMLQLVF